MNVVRDINLQVGIFLFDIYAVGPVDFSHTDNRHIAAAEFEHCQTYLQKKLVKLFAFLRLSCEWCSPFGRQKQTEPLSEQGPHP